MKSKIISAKGLLKPCPFCKREFVFVQEFYIDSEGEHHGNQYFIHKAYNKKTEQICALDEINGTFYIDADDADLENNFIGEKAQAWNEQNPMPMTEKRS